MTNEEREQIVKIHGPEFTRMDIPTYIRNRDQEEEWKNFKSKIEFEKRQMDQITESIMNPTKPYEIYMKSHCEAPDYEDRCYAHSKEEAAEIFAKRMSQGSEDYWDAKDIIDHVKEI